MTLPGSPDVQERFQECVASWRLTIQQVRETETSVIGFGLQLDRPIVLKVIKRPGDEWQSGPILAAFRGNAVVDVIAHMEGALLLPRLIPGTSLVPMVLSGDDERATSILADVIKRMSPGDAVVPVPNAEAWARGFERYRLSGDAQVELALVNRAEQTYLDLCQSQTRTRLLHGDLHHGNVLYDLDREWLAIDPKGVIGEVEFEVGAVLRNPTPEVMTDPEVIVSRVRGFAVDLGLDPARILGWAFAQAVLSYLWMIEDGYRIEPGDSTLVLARMLEDLFKG